jgi:hypothetical protein
MKKTPRFKMSMRTRKMLKLSPEDEKKLSALKKTKRAVDFLLTDEIFSRSDFSVVIKGFRKGAQEARKKGDKITALYYDEFAKKLKHVRSKHK